MSADSEGAISPTPNDPTLVCALCSERLSADEAIWIPAIDRPVHDDCLQRALEDIA